jgi:hypothetical protein
MHNQPQDHCEDHENDRYKDVEQHNGARTHGPQELNLPGAPSLAAQVKPLR